jgi:EVE domain
MTDAQQFRAATVSADHAARACDRGILQVNHGRSGPLNRMRPGDGVVIYSPRDSYPDGAALQAFTVIGRVAEGETCPGDMGGGFHPFRRDIRWQASSPAPIRPLLETLDLTRGRANWGMAFRFGLTRITPADFARIADAMKIAPDPA